MNTLQVLGTFGAVAGLFSIPSAPHEASVLLLASLLVFAIGRMIQG